jgi:hypothetical protein
MRRLEKDGFEVEERRYHYWDRITYVLHNGEWYPIAGIYHKDNNTSIETEYKWREVEGYLSDGRFNDMAEYLKHCAGYDSIDMNGEYISGWRW